MKSASYVINRIPLSTINTKSPYELMFEEKHFLLDVMKGKDVGNASILNLIWLLFHEMLSLMKYHYIMKEMRLVGIPY